MDFRSSCLAKIILPIVEESTGELVNGKGGWWKPTDMTPQRSLSNVDEVEALDF